MRRSPLFALLFPFALGLASCLENEEEIEIRPDGSVHVRVTARGKPADLADGYPVPFGGPWQPAGEDTALWLEHVGPDTGSLEVRERVAAGAWSRAAAGAERDPVLGSEATFADATLLPAHFAPAAAPYADAYLARSASLTVVRRGPRVVYTFERRFLSRERRGADLDRAARARLAQPLVEKLDAGGPFEGAERAEICAAYSAAMAEACGRGVGRALAEVYTAGDASLPLGVFDGAVAAAQQVARRIAPAERLLDAWEKTEQQQARAAEGAPAPGAENPLEALETELRDGLRGVVGGLASEGVDPATLNGILYRLEWLFTSHDHTDDLAGETFRVKVRMPGTVVAGNHDRVEDGRAVFEFDGGELAAADVVLRLVSVVE